MSGNGEARDLWAEMMQADGATIELVIERTRIEHGRTVSAEAMGDLIELATAWIGTRVMRRWDATSEPPSAVRVIISAEAQ